MNNTQITTVLGFDYGAKRIGVATGQTITGTATPVTALTAVNNSPDWDSIQKLIRQWKPDALIVGMPYFLDGKPSEMTKIVQGFCEQLEKRFDKSVYQVNETLSSYEAELEKKHENRQAQQAGD